MPHSLDGSRPIREHGEDSMEAFPTEGRVLRSVGFDDGPFSREARGSVRIAGAVCAGTRFEGLVFGAVRRDGWNATDQLSRLLLGGKFLPQIHLVLLDGLTFGGFNVVDLETLAIRLERPCVAVMRRPPDLRAVERALSHLPRNRQRLELFERAGPVHVHPPFVFQVRGADPAEVVCALRRITDRGHVPEPLRLAHLIASAVVRGESGNRA